MATLEIRDLHVTVEADNATKEILKGVDLTVKQGETHAIMGPNGPASPPWPTRWPVTPPSTRSPAAR